MGKCHSIVIDSKIKHTLYAISEINIIHFSLIYIIWNDLFRVQRQTAGKKHCKPRPQVAYCWRNIDYVNVSLWIESPGVAQCALSLSLFSSTVSLALPIHSPCCVFLLQACCDLHLLRAQTDSFKDFFFPFYDRPSFILPGVHSTGFIGPSLFFQAGLLGYAAGSGAVGEHRANLPQVKGGFTTLRYRWLNTLSIILTQSSGTSAPRFLSMKYRTGIEVNTLWDN